MRELLNLMKKHVWLIMVLLVVIALAILSAEFPGVFKKMNSFIGGTTIKTSAVSAKELAVCKKSNKLYLDLIFYQKKNAKQLGLIQKMNQKNKILSDSLAELKKELGKFKTTNSDLQKKLRKLQSSYNQLSGTYNYIFSELKKCRKKKQPKEMSKKVARTTIKVHRDYTRSTNKDFTAAQYEGIVTGDYGVTINKSGFLTYYLSQKTFMSAHPTVKAPAIPWNKHVAVTRRNVNGQEYYLATDTLHRVTTTEITTKRVYRWSWYIGKNKDWGYKMYIPHELVKPAQEDTIKGIFKNGKGGAEFRSRLNYRVKQNQ